ncbi:MAG: UPF0149 family protein [Gammaproteobacteria bacterium]|nr:UPF0149 family protein [Gammaproteobacteria bacterium]
MQFDYVSVTEVLFRIGPGNEASECHGVLCGLLCAKGGGAAGLWVNHIMSQINEANEVPPGELETLLNPIILESQRQLTSVECDFQPILPEDTASVAEKTVALAQWAQGFLVGMSFGGIKDLKELPADSMEILIDFTKIAQAGKYDIEGTEEEDAAFTEISEYLRAGVLLVYQELNSPSVTHPVDKSRLH